MNRVDNDASSEKGNILDYFLASKRRMVGAVIGGGTALGLVMGGSILALGHSFNKADNDRINEIRACLSDVMGDPDFCGPLTDSDIYSTQRCMDVPDEGVDGYLGRTVVADLRKVIGRNCVSVSGRK